MANDTSDYLTIHHLQLEDYIIFVLTLLISLAIGFYYAFTGGKQKTVQEYLVGNRQMGIIPVAMSLLASSISALGMVALPAEIYLYGAGIIYSGVGMCLAMPVIASCYLPVFYELQLTSAYEYLELRFNSVLRIIGSFICILQTLIYISFVLYAPSLAMSQVTGLNLWASVVTVAVLGTVYTALGGIKAVMWTDVFQIIIVFVALIISFVKGTIDVGGFSYVFDKGLEGRRFYLSMEPDLRIRYTVWSSTIGSFFKWVGFYGIGQMMIQRYISTPSLTKAKLTIIFNLFGNGIFQLISLVGGILIYAKYWDCDPLTTQRVHSADQLLPLFVIDTLHMYPGLTGLLIAGLFSGSLSTISSALNSMAALILEDFIKLFRRWRNMSQEKAAKVSKILTALLGIVALLLVPIFSTLGPILKTHSYNSFTFLGIALALFSLGMFVPWANSFGATVGISVGFVFSQWMSIGTQLTKPFTSVSPISVDGCVEYNISFANPDPINENGEDVFPLYQIAFEWILCLSALPAFIVGMIASGLHNPTKLEDLDLRLISPPVKYLLKKYFKNRIRNEELPSEDLKSRSLLMKPTSKNENQRFS